MKWIPLFTLAALCIGFAGGRAATKAETAENHKIADGVYIGNVYVGGMTEEEAKKHFCKPASEQELDHRNYPGGETRNEFYLRNVHGLWHCADVDKENLLIVAHKGTIQNIIFRWLGMDMQQVAAFNFSVDVQPASVTVLGINKWHEHAVFRLNDVSHLTQGKGFGVFEFKYEK